MKPQPNIDTILGAMEVIKREISLGTVRKTRKTSAEVSRILAKRESKIKKMGDKQTQK